MRALSQLQIGIRVATLTAMLVVGVLPFSTAGAQAKSPAKAPARSPNQGETAGSFIMRQGVDTVAVENFERSRSQLHGVIQTRSGGKGEYTATITPNELVSKLEIIATAVNGQSTSRGVLTFVGDTVVADAGGGKVQRVTTQRDAEPWINPSFAFTELLVRRARVVGGNVVQIPLFTVQGGRTILATVTKLGGDSLSISAADAVLRVHVDPSGRVLSGSVPAQGVIVTRVESGSTGGRAQLSKPDYSAPASAPYVSEDVRVPSPGGFTLAGTLTLPKKQSGPAPAAVMITGSGPNDRDESIAGVPGYRPFRQIADTLGRRGIAVLRLDDRGFGASGGDASQATTANLADDTRAALAYLRGRRDIDSRRLFLIGHSEGGIIAPLVAWTDPSLKGIVLLAGAARPGMDIMRAQNRYNIQTDTSIPAAGRDSAMKAREVMLNTAVSSQPWTRYFATYDPAVTARKVHTPVLILQGANDRQVSPDQAEMLEATFRSGGNKDVTTRVFPGLDHLFLTDATGSWTGYASLPSKQVDPSVLGAIADWIAAKSM
ncbi:MAG: alpha/beta hydrolase family protein [Gemmatimonadaceae bacterium]